jgi:cytochrome P450
MEAAKAHAASLPLDQIDVSDPKLYQDDAWEPYFARLRREDPVHLTPSPLYGPFWSVTRFRDIMQVETSHQIYSSDMTLGGITLLDQPPEFRLPNLIAMDPPKHDEQRKVVSPIVAPTNLQNMAGIIRERAARILDGLPRNETFDWVDLVSVELTTQMLATRFDYPFEQRRQLTHWSNVAICNINAPDAEVRSEPERFAEMQAMAEAMIALWRERVQAPPRYDLISMLAHGGATRDLPSRPHERMGTLLLLIVGGNDTTRNSISGGVWALNQHPDEYRKLRTNPGLIPGLVPEIIRWQTPVIYMRRTALQDADLGGKQICKGDKVAMWYLSGNRDEAEIERANEFIIDRPRPRHHLSFGFGIHRCVGNRLAELQLTILWEEILKRGLVIEAMGEPKRVYSSFIHGITAPAGAHPRLDHAGGHDPG